MNLNATVELLSTGRSIQAAAPKQDATFKPVHAGAHDHFTKLGYLHTGNKNRGGIKTSHYFKAKNGNSHNIAVQADGSYIKTSRTPSGSKRTRGKIDAKGMKCGGPGSGRHKESADTSDAAKNIADIKNYGYKAADAANRTVYTHPNGTVLTHDKNSGHWQGFSPNSNTHLDTRDMPHADDPAEYSDYAHGFARVNR